MDEITQRVRAVGARRRRLREELAAADRELRDIMPAARAVLTHEQIRSHTGLSIQTIRAYASR
ncbi:hypothetical protein ACIREM_43530 [Streptomyces shenzhenensis]|uniref:hypothetical protein n=1 Tax=Streptomyces shenzhenensis TaxID=943815 RepID=UPI003801D225